MSNVIRLYPLPQEERPLEGLYLSHDLRSIDLDGRPFVYTNYITSLDGRIAVAGKEGELTIPKRITNDRDWRLFQELAIQADLLFTSGRYLREYEEGRSQEILQIYDDPRLEDLRDWRSGRGLPPYPDLAVISASADFPIPEALRSGDRRIHVVTTKTAEPDRLRSLEGVAEICIAGDETVDGGRMVRALFERGYRLMYNTTGPKVLHLLVSAGEVDRLYLTRTGRVLGGSPYSTIVEGDLLKTPVDFRLAGLYYDPAGIEGLGQLFSVYDLNRNPPVRLSRDDDHH